jgi:glyoxylase-like metal-dependent hydrolase (beta-lactamase superfamily II)
MTSVAMTGSEPVVAGETVRIHYVPAGATSAYLVETDGGLTLVDTGLSYAAQTIQSRLAALGRDDLCLIYITHAHIDHYGAAAELRRATGALIAIHAGDAEALAAGDTRLGNVRDWGWSEMPLPLVEELIRVEPTEPDIIVEDGQHLTHCGLDATVVHTPGHTAGSSTLLVEGKYAFAGDLLSTTGGLHAQSSYAQDWSQIAPSVEKLRSLEPELVFPGHGQTAATGAMLNEMEISGPAANPGAAGPAGKPTP